MNDWSHGYNVSLGYTYGFYRELAPDWLDLCARISGFVPPTRGANGSFRYLELGSGQGVGLCLLAAANPSAEFVGIDFNPEHIAHSKGLAAAAGLSNIRFIEGDFAALGASWPADLGQFDYVVMHGIYSWIPPEVRRALVRCLDHAVPPGGLVYNSYNTKPGWVSTMPFQHMARRMQMVTAKPGPAVIDDTVKLFESLGESNSAIFRVLPTLKARIDSVKTQNRAYLVQEYLHENWHPLWFSEAAAEFGAAKLNFVGAATIAELMLPGLLPPATRDIINAQTDSVLRQEVQDCAINQSFRRDIFCRGARRTFNRGIDTAFDSELYLVNAPKDDGEPLKIGTAFGELSLKHDSFAEAIAALETGPKTIGELVALPNFRKQGMSSAIQTLLLLIHMGGIGVGAAKRGDAKPAQRLNSVIARTVCEGAPYTHFAVPALGSALSVSDIDCMLFDTWAGAPKADAAKLGKGLAERLAKVGRKLQQNGQPIDGAAAQERIDAMSATFLEQSLPRWRKLGAVA
ncbi:class I SAM-dependent methyltransferase [Sphingomonas colocasiae]|uniref:Class I SAM-dependent methyltransferase n=1 Tax=Sphingomonas colocasiae TaxID=1848973 RepID=A0ABS7PT19_9SPHN|nr:class I SAM-dependent methyltransferase [Sphingomonas colocasiae]MBY8824495.1 class I SAM-dependent methyltransferase [Sphingomonas colocasiae]